MWVSGCTVRGCETWTSVPFPVYSQTLGVDRYPEKQLPFFEWHTYIILGFSFDGRAECPRIGKLMVQDSAGSQPNSATFLGVLEIVIKPPVEGVLEGYVYICIYIYVFV